MRTKYLNNNGQRVRIVCLNMITSTDYATVGLMTSNPGSTEEIVRYDNGGIGIDHHHNLLMVPPEVANDVVLECFDGAGFSFMRHFSNMDGDIYEVYPEGLSSRTCIGEGDGQLERYDLARELSIDIPFNDALRYAGEHPDDAALRAHRKEEADTGNM